LDGSYLWDAYAANKRGVAAVLPSSGGLAISCGCGRYFRPGAEPSWRNAVAEEGAAVRGDAPNQARTAGFGADRNITNSLINPFWIQDIR
jgi:hypothetical protein